MSSTIDLGDDDGLVIVRMGKIEVELDLYDIHDQLVAIYQNHKDGGASGFHEAILELMVAHGLPGGSHRMADRFAQQIFAEVKRLKNADGGGLLQGSPDSTEPILSD